MKGGEEMINHKQLSSNKRKLADACSDFLDEQPDALAVAVVSREGMCIVAPSWFSHAGEFADHVSKWNPSDS